MSTPIVTFRALADNSVVALTNNHDAYAVNVDKVIEYISKMKEITGGTDVEFNNTFRQFCKDRVFFTFEPITDKHAGDFVNKGFVPEVVECVLLSDDRVAMNVNGNIEIFYAEDGNQIFKTMEDAEMKAKENAFAANSKCLDILTEKRRQLKELLHAINGEIETRIEFKKSLNVQ